MYYLWGKILYVLYTSIYILYTCYLSATCLAAPFGFVCVCVTIPQGGAVNLDGTNSVWDSQVVTEEHQRDESTVHDALTHIHINQQRSLNYRTEAALDKQNSSHCHSLWQTTVHCAKVVHGLGECFCGLLFNQHYNQAPQVTDSISRMECQKIHLRFRLQGYKI